MNVYTAEIQRLTMPSGFTGEGLRRTVQLAFVNGFPDDILRWLQQLQLIQLLCLNERRV